MCDLCLILHKICCKMVWEFFEIWNFLWELPSRLAKFCEILSQSVRYGMYAQIAQADSLDPDQMQRSLHLIWVYTVCH